MRKRGHPPGIDELVHVEEGSAIRPTPQEAVIMGQGVPYSVDIDVRIVAIGSGKERPRDDSHPILDNSR